MCTFVQVLFILALCTACTAQHAPLSEEQDTRSQSQEVPPADLSMEEPAQASITAPEASGSPTVNCSDVKLGAWFSIWSGVRLNKTKTSNVLECCEACQRTQNCTTWVRRRTRGTCVLFNVQAAGFQRDPFRKVDIGGFVGQKTRLAAFLRAPQANRPPKCRINKGVTYPDGIVLVQGRAPTSWYCCEVCRTSGDCNSWYFNKRTNGCVLNRNVPTARELPSSPFLSGVVSN